MSKLAIFHRTSTYMMELSVLVTLLGLYLGYVVDGQVGLGGQIAGHLMVLLGPCGLKFGAVLRLAVNEENKKRYPGSHLAGGRPLAVLS